jgi:hypothetical protein
MSIGVIKGQKNLSETLCVLPVSAFRFGKKTEEEVSRLKWSVSRADGRS